MRMNRACLVSTVAVTVAAAMTAGCDGPTDPGSIGHPAGFVTATLSLGQRPFGVAVSSHGVVYVTRLDATHMTRMDLPALQLSDSVAVGWVPTAVAFHPDDATAYVTNQFSQELGVVNVASDIQVETVQIGGDPFMVAVSPDGGRIYVTANTDSLFVLDGSSHTVLTSLPVQGAPNGIAFHPATARVYVSAFVGGTVTEIEGSSVLRTIPVGGAPQGLALSPDGNDLFVANEDGPLQVVDLSSGNVTALSGIAESGFGLGQSPDGAVLYVTIPSAGKVVVVDRASREVENTIEVGGRPRRIGFDRSGTTAVVANEAGWVDIIR